MSKWDKLRQAAREASKFRGSTPNYYVPIQAPLILELISEAEREGADKSDAIFTERTPDGWIEFRRMGDRSLIMKFPMSRLQEYLLQAESKPKTVVEEIWGFIQPRNTGSYTLENGLVLRMALAEAVEFIQRTNKQLDGMGVPYNNKSFPSILAILKGSKTRDIPKP